MNTGANLLVDAYISWLRSNVSAESLEQGVTELTTPFLDRHNDYLQVYVERQGDIYLLSDDGYILGELKSIGVESRGSRREQLLAELISGYGVTINGSELQTKASDSELGQRVHNMVQAMLSVDDMFVLAQPTVNNIFVEDVAKFFDDRDIRYTPRAKFSGKSGLDHLVDFVVPKSRKSPERIVSVVNTPRRDRVSNLLFAVNDTRAVRGLDTIYYALVNDARQGVSAEILRALDEYSVKAQLWSRRELLVDELVT